MNKYQSGGASEAALIRRLSNEGQNELIKRIKSFYLPEYPIELDLYGHRFILKNINSNIKFL